MNQKKDNVILTVDDHRMHGPETRLCGIMTVKDMEELYKQINNVDASTYACPTGISAELNSNRQTSKNFLFRNAKNNSDEQITITLYIAREDTHCDATNSEDCLHKIISGKCKDKFVINLLAKKLFADKYQNNER